MELDKELIEFLDEFSDSPPSTFFERDPTPDTTTVRAMNFALRSMISQLRSPINTEAEAVTKWIIYKQAGPHRRQKFFGFFRQLSRLVRKYNDQTLIKKLNPILKKAENCGDNMYKLEKTAIRYMSCSYLKRVYLLDRIRETCVKCAEGAMGLLELEHWTNLCLVIVSLCAQVHSDVVAQLLEMEKVYKVGVGVFRSVDERFPESLNDLQVVKKIKDESRVYDERQTSNLSAISRLMKFSASRIEEAQSENDLRLKASEILQEILTDEMTSSTPVASKKPSSVQLDMSDLGISISREDASFLNSTIQSTSTTLLFKSDEEEEEDILMSPNLFAPKSLKKKAQKRKSTELAATPKSSFLSSTLDLLGGKKKTKKQKKAKNC